MMESFIYTELYNVSALVGILKNQYNVVEIEILEKGLNQESGQAMVKLTLEMVGSIKKQIKKNDE